MNPFVKFFDALTYEHTHTEGSKIHLSSHINHNDYNFVVCFHVYLIEIIT
jgi:hypothetical protein